MRLLIYFALLSLAACAKPTILAANIQEKYKPKRVKNGNRKLFLTEDDIGYFNYNLIAADTGNFVDGNWQEEPLSINLIQSHDLILCLRELLQVMSEGEHIRGFCPPHTAYGDKQKEKVPANTILAVELKLVRIVKRGMLGEDYVQFLDSKKKERELKQKKDEL